MHNQLRTWALSAALAIGYCLAGWVGSTASVGDSAHASVWPQTGVALAAFLLWGRNALPGLLAGAIIFGITACRALIDSGWNYIPAGLIRGVGEIAGAWLGAWCTQRYAGGRAAFERTRSVLRFVLLAALAATAVGTMFSLGCVAAQSGLASMQTLKIWLMNWLGSAAGVLLLTPLIIVWSNRPLRRFTPGECLEPALIVFALAISSLLVFSDRLVESEGVPLAFLTVLVPVWAAFRFGRRGATLLVFLLGVIAVIGTRQDQGPFVVGQPALSLLLLQNFLIVTAVLGLVVAAGVHQTQVLDEHLSSSEHRYRSLFYSNPLPMWVFDQETLRFLAVNQAALDHYGYSSQEFLAMSMADLRPPGEVPAFRKAMEHHGTNATLASQTLHRRKDGSLLEVELIRHDITFADRPAALVASIDVTERNRAQRRSAVYSELGQRLSATRTTREAARIMAEAADTLFGWHACFFDLCSGQPGELENVLCIDTINGTRVESPSERQPAGPISRQVLGTGQALLLDEQQGETVRFGDTSRRSASIMFVPLRRDGKVLGVFSIQSYHPKAYTGEDLKTLQTLVDHGTGALERIRVEADLESQLAERRRAEQEIMRLNAELERRVGDRTAQLEAINKELETFAYSVSHDLRAPLRSIRGFSEVLLERYGPELDPRGREFLRRTCESSHHMDRLIDDLLKFSRVSRNELHRLPVNLSALAASVAGELSKADPERQVELVIQPDLEGFGDERLLRIVLDNLFRNAWKFTGRKPKARIEFGREPEDPAPFFVRDDGAGFDMQYATKLFGVFQRLHSGSEFPGTGIGLATVQRIINRHGGRVWATGEVDKGATFYFTLPAPADM